MRPVGIILVFMNLLFSIATCALIVVVYSTRANWKKGYDDAAAQSQVAAAAYKTERQAHDNDLKSRDEELTSLRNKITALANDVAAAKDARDKTKQLMDKYMLTTAGDKASNDVLVAQVSQLGKELESLKGERTDREKRIRDLETEKNVERKDRVEAQVKLASLQSRNERLQADFSELTNKYRILDKELQSKGIDPGSILNKDAVPAPKNVQGAITNVNDRGLTEISLGSDSGIREGNVLLVYRLNAQDATKSLYLGTVRISKSDPKKAVGTFEAAPTSRVKVPSVGDYVRTSFN